MRFINITNNWTWHEFSISSYKPEYHSNNIQSIKDFGILWRKVDDLRHSTQKKMDWRDKRCLISFMQSFKVTHVTIPPGMHMARNSFSWLYYLSIEYFYSWWMIKENTTFEIL